MQMQVSSLIKKRASFHLHISSVHTYPINDGYFCSASTSMVHQEPFQEMVLPDIIIEVPEVPAV